MAFRSFPSDVFDTLNDKNAFHLSGDADCASPDSVTSAGALFLSSVRDGVVERLQYMDDDDREAFAADVGTVNDFVPEIADNAPDVYTHTLWSEFVDLAAYNEDPTELGEDGSDMETAARVCLYIIAGRLANALFEEAHSLFAAAIAMDDDDDEEEEG